MPDSSLHDDLREEYRIVQGHYESYDQKTIALKSLATPLLGTGLAFGVKEHQVSIVAITIAIALCLWLLEALWKGFQYAYVPRIQELETWFRSDPKNPISAFQIFSSWGYKGRTFSKKVGSVIHTILLPFVMLPYILIVVAGVAICFYLTAPGPSPQVERKLEQQAGRDIAQGRCPEARARALQAGDLDLAVKIQTICEPEKVSRR